MQMTTNELDAIVESHNQWVQGHAGGRRADLSGADLSEADLSGADLSEADLSGADLSEADLSEADLREVYLMGEIIKKAPLQLSGLMWPIVITEKFMVIGCQRHSHSEWLQMDDDEISKMHPDAQAFWGKHKSALMGICESHATSDDH